MIVPKEHNFTAYQGASFEKDFQVTDTDLTDVFIEFTIKILSSPKQFIYANTGNDKVIVTDAVTGKFFIQIPEVAAMKYPGKYSLKFRFPSGKISRILEGDIILDTDPVAP